MEKAVMKALLELVQTGGPAAIAVLALMAWWVERKEARALQDKLLSLAMAQVENATKVESALQAVKELVQQALQRVR